MQVANDARDRGEITEPTNSTVDDRMGQDIGRDEDTAERAMAPDGRCRRPAIMTGAAA